MCGLYRNAPGLLVQPDNTFAQPFEQVNDSFRQFLDDLCGDAPLPPLEPGTPGGKCPVAYNVAHRLTFELFGGGTQFRTGTITVTGPIGAIARRQRPDDSTQWQWGFYFAGGSNFFPMGAFPKNSFEARSTSATITSITPVVPGTDNCGPRPPQFQPTAPTGNPYNPPVEYKDRGTTVNVNVSIPPIIIPPGLVQVNPKVEVKIGPNKVVFDLSGGKLSFEPNITIPITIGGGPNGENPNPPISLPDNDPDLSARFNRIDALLAQIAECACDDPDVSALVPTPGTEAVSQCVSVPITRNRFCAIAITQIPANPKTEPGGAAPDVLFAGWAWFKAGDYLFERSPIDAQGKLFKNPGGAEAFCYTLRNGFRGVPVTLDEAIPPG